MKKIVTAILAIATSIALLGCTAAETASHQASMAADNFEVARELTVFNNVTGEILFIAQGCMSIEVDDLDSQLEIVVKQPEGNFEKHFVGLNQTTTYIVKDLHGVDVENFRYQIAINPDMILPFEFKMVVGGE